MFCFGDAVIFKVRLADEGTRREHETLAFLVEERLSFDIPKLPSYGEEDGKTYLFESLIPGKTLD